MSIADLGMHIGHLCPTPLSQQGMAELGTSVRTGGRKKAQQSHSCSPSLAVPLLDFDQPSEAKADDVKHAPALAAELFLGSPGHHFQKDIPIAIVDTAALQRQPKTGHQLLPRVEPSFAVKALWETADEVDLGARGPAASQEHKHHCC